MIDYTRLGIIIALSIPIGLSLNELYCSIVALLRYILFEKEGKNGTAKEDDKR